MQLPMDFEMNNDWVIKLNIKKYYILPTIYFNGEYFIIRLINIMNKYTNTLFFGMTIPH